MDSIKHCLYRALPARRRGIKAAGLPAIASRIAIVAALAGFAAHDAAAEILTAPATFDYGGFDWGIDRFPVYTVDTDAAAEGRTGVLKYTIGATPPSASFFSYQGYTAASGLGAGTGFIKADVFIPADWATGSSSAGAVGAEGNFEAVGLWGVLGAPGGTQAFPIIRFTNQDGVGKISVYDYDDWVEVPGVTIDYGAWNTLEVSYLKDGEGTGGYKADILLNGEVIYTILDLHDIDYPGAPPIGDSTSLQSLTLTGYNNKTAPYDVLWSDVTASAGLTWGERPSGASYVWEQDRIAPFSTDRLPEYQGRSDVLALTLDPSQHHTNTGGDYRQLNYQGYHTPTGLGAGGGFISADLWIPAEWATSTTTFVELDGNHDEYVSTGNFVTTGLWGVIGIPGATAQPQAFPEVAFTNVHGVGEISIWAVDDEIYLQPTIQYGAWNSFKIQLVPNATTASGLAVDIYLNDEKIYTLTEIADNDFPDAPLASVDTSVLYEAIIQSFNNGVDDFTAFWSNFRIGTVYVPGSGPISGTIDGDLIIPPSTDGEPITFAPGTVITGSVIISGNPDGTTPPVVFQGDTNIGGDFGGDGVTFSFPTDGSTVVIGGDLNLGPGATITGGSPDNPVKIVGDANIGPGASLGGNLDIQGNLNFSGALEPGNSPGIVNVAGNYTALPAVGDDTIPSGTFEVNLSSRAPTPGGGAGNPDGYDQVTITGNADGTTLISLKRWSSSRSDPLGRIGAIDLIRVDGTVAPGAFVMPGRFTQAGQELELVTRNEGGTTVIGLGAFLQDESFGFAALPSVSQQATLEILGTYAERRGLDAADGTTPGSRVWGRIGAAGFETDDGVSYDQDVTFGQSGVDLVVVDGLRAGFMASYGRSSTDVATETGTGELSGDLWAVGLYGSWSDGGAYADAVLQFGWNDWRFSPTSGSSTRVDSTVVTAAVEAGMGLAVTDALTLTPWAQLVWQSADFDAADSPYFDEASFDDASSVLLRGGVRLSARFGDLHPYAGVALAHDLAGDNRTVIDGTAVDSGTGGTRVELSAGIDAVLGEGISGYIDAGLSQGLSDADLSSLRGSAGLKIAF